ncbi:K+ efflux antiporter 1 [Gossypium australe]|uniref:K+ efflux antiporter 1 n=1 Tax=Gossypium australe TaxID=47621 RepID=A0A5B6UQQ9_9ROSI|nr:K+ efflux antiporter 1 [Gossypium australe]
MDFTCCYKHPTIIHGDEVTRYRILDPFRRRNFSYNVFNPKHGSKTWSLRKMKRNMAYSSRLSSNLVLKGNFDSPLCGTYLATSFFCGLHDVSKVRGVKSHCQGSDSSPYADGNDRNAEFAESSNESSSSLGEEVRNVSGEVETPTLDELRELVHKAMEELKVARLNSRMFEEKAQEISEAAIASRDKATNAWNHVNSRLNVMQDIVNEECIAKEAVQKATMALSLAEARLQVAVDSFELLENGNGSVESYGKSDAQMDVREDNGVLLDAQYEIRECQKKLANCEVELRQVWSKKEELLKEVERLKDVAENAQMDALEAEEDVANIILLAEKAVAFEVEATQRLNGAEIALKRSEKSLSSLTVDTAESAQGQVLGEGNIVKEEKISQGGYSDAFLEIKGDALTNGDTLIGKPKADILSDEAKKRFEDHKQFFDFSNYGNVMLGLDSIKEAEVEAEKSKNVQPKKSDTPKNVTTETSPLNTPKSLLNKSSRFLSASFFSLTVDGTKLTPAPVAQGFLESATKQIPKLVVGLLLFGAGVAFYANQTERSAHLLQQPDAITSSVEVSPNAKPMIHKVQNFPKRIKKIVAMLPHQEVFDPAPFINFPFDSFDLNHTLYGCLSAAYFYMNDEEASLFDVLCLLLASVIFVPIFQKIPGGSPVLGFLVAGILIGPYGLSIIHHVHGTKAIADLGVVFLLFNIGLELSVERLSSMKKYVFGLGSAQVLMTAVAVGLVAHFVSGQPGPAAMVIGNGLALSSTAVVLQDYRSEVKDLAVVVLLILIPLISPNSSKGEIGFRAIAEALGLAVVKAAVSITTIIAGGRLLLRPIYRKIAENQNPEIFSANTLLVILGTSLLTAGAGLSMALGAFLSGLLLAETEFSLQVESDIAPYRGLLLGLFFMTVGMSIDPKLLVSNFPVIMEALGLLIGGKIILVAFVGTLFGISIVSAIRVGLLLAPGGEFAFVAFGEAVNQGIMSSQLSSLLFLVVGISMALTPWLAAGGQLIFSHFELHDVRRLLPVESEVHV